MQRLWYLLRYLSQLAPIITIGSSLHSGTQCNRVNRVAKNHRSGFPIL